MRSFTLPIMLSMVTALLGACNRGDHSRLIREPGTYQLGAQRVLLVTADGAQKLSYSFEEAGRSVKVPLEIAASEPFVFYWDAPSATLWAATAERIWQTKGADVKFDSQNSDVLGRAPAGFRDAVTQTFK